MYENYFQMIWPFNILQVQPVSLLTGAVYSYIIHQGSKYIGPRQLMPISSKITPHEQLLINGKMHTAVARQNLPEIPNVFWPRLCTLENRCDGHYLLQCSSSGEPRLELDMPFLA